MSEPMGIEVVVGGNLNAKFLNELAEALEQDASDITGPTTVEELREVAANKQSIKWYATSNWGNCDTLKDFCQDHNLSFEHYTNASGEYDPDKVYWYPGLGDPVTVNTNSEGNQIVHVSAIKPITDFLLAIATNGVESTLPLYVGNDNLKDIVEAGLKKPSKVLPLIKERLDEIMEAEDYEIPPFSITE